MKIGSSQHVNSPNYLIKAHHSFPRKGVSNQGNDIVIFDNPDVAENFWEIDGQRYPKASVNSIFTEYNYFDHVIKIFHFIQVIDLGVQVDLITLKKVQLFEV